MTIEDVIKLQTKTNVKIAHTVHMSRHYVLIDKY